MRCATRLILSLFFLAMLLRPAAAADPVAPERLKAGEEFVDRMAAGDFAAAGATFDATMKNALPEAKLKEIWTGLAASVGRFQKRTGVRGEKSGAYDVVHVACAFEKAVLDTKVVFDAQGRVAGLFFAPGEAAGAEWQPPAYVKKEAFQEKDVTVGSGDWALPGTLSLPASGGPFPALVLVHGSGPQDRDETIGPNKTFRDLAWGLASRGVAVLRYEKRTKEHASRMAALKSLTVKEETIDDAVAAVKLLQSTPGIDPKRVFVLGHSLGGMVAPRIAERTTGLAGLVIMAGAARPLEDVTLEQLDWIGSLPATSEEEKKQLAALKDAMRKVKALDPSTADPAEMIMGASAGYWLDLRAVPPAEAAAKLHLPMLVLQGERDYQVTMADFALWKAALGGRPEVTFVSWPDLNHLFTAGTGKATPAEYEKPGHVAPVVIERIADWIAKAGPRG